MAYQTPAHIVAAAQGRLGQGVQTKAVSSLARALLNPAAWQHAQTPSASAVQRIGHTPSSAGPYSDLQTQTFGNTLALQRAGRIARNTIANYPFGTVRQ
jgi:hypothetical protein